MYNFRSVVRRHPKLLIACVAFALSQVALGVLWFYSSPQQWHEPALFVLGILALSFGLPDVSSLLRGEAEMEHRAAEALLTTLEDEGLLTLALEAKHPEHPKQCYETAGALRRRVTSVLTLVGRSSDLYVHGDRFRELLNDFVRALERTSIERFDRETDLSAEQFGKFRSALSELRSQCAKQLREFEKVHRVNVERLVTQIEESIPSVMPNENEYE